LSVLALGAGAKLMTASVARAALVLLGLCVLVVHASVAARLATGLGAVVVLLGSVAALPAAPRSVRQLPGIHRVAVLADRVPFPWKPQLADHVPAPIIEASFSVPVAAAAGSAPSGGQALAATTPAPVRAEPTPPSLPPTAKLEGFRHQWQTWNNCGPATITMAASFFGRKETQTDAARILKTNPEDKNVSPHELVDYVKSLGLDATWRVGGDLTRLKQLLASQIPVVVEVWIAPEPGDWMGHYRLLTGYDDSTGRFISYDSVQTPGPNLSQPYARFDEDWRVFNRTYIPVYTKEQAPLVERILGVDLDHKTMHERALVAAQRETLMLPDDGFAWFNLGTNLTALGRTAEAAQAFDKARTLKLPWRMLWYQFAPFEAYLAEGRAQDVLALATANLQRSNDLEESHYYKGRALQAQGQAPQARAAYQAALKANAKYTPASHSLAQLG